MQTIFEKSQEGQSAYSLPKLDDAFLSFYPPKDYLREEEIALPEVSELDLTRHFSLLARRNIGIDTHFYPLGSCTMKFNPRINEVCASLHEVLSCHPLAPEENVQGCLQIIYELKERLCQICGMDDGSLVPNAGAQGEFASIRMIRAYHQDRGDYERDEILIPDNAHGTNPATATLCGYKTVSIKTNSNGDIDLEELKNKVSEKTAGLMLTNPNTLGLFMSNILDVADIVHQAGGLLFYDGANLNAILNIVRPGDMGFDVMHLNLHKTFSTPHGGGGPGAGPILCKKILAPFLPMPKVIKEENNYKIFWSNREKSIGKIATFNGNFAIYLRAYLYILLHGDYGLRRVAEVAVINANYLKKSLEKFFTIPFKQYCMHEFVVQADNYLGQGVKALDIAKRLLDYGVHAPTVYFPLIVKEAMLIEPTETESKDTLDRFISIIEHIVEEIKSDSNVVKEAPHTMVVSRLNEVYAAKNPKLSSIESKN